MLGLQACTTIHDKIMLLFKVARDGLAEKAEDSRSEGDGGAMPDHLPGRGVSRYKGPQAGVHMQQGSGRRPKRPE